ncbi:DUF2793 domain-containing protein [Xanthobacteraceae bacterium Astr-EGSB]|uniref:DUF2793 domain-containing protein n=1 Tax=Astrobacterium formosum TaxID=3069710 RepID=UPI0027B08D2B|nr:DUF2793 domain-containing protein [Xanthobacteraceae bacterium Astr-EGSB]
MTQSPNLALPYLAAAQAQKHVTVNEALRLLDAVVMLAILDRDLAAPPPSPVDGARYIVGAGATGAWAGHTGAIAAWQDGAWTFIAPRPGFLAYVVDEAGLAVFDGTSWQGVGGGGSPSALDDLTRLGIGTAADAANPFAAKLNNALWTARTVAEGGDGTLRYKMNKESAAATLSLLMQTAYSGRAEIGLTGDDDLHVKTSPDGALWTEALRIATTTGATAVGRAFSLAGVLSPAEITADQNDYDPAGLAGASLVRLSADAPRHLTGLAGGASGRILTLVNVGAAAITLDGESAASAAADRFAIGSAIVIGPDQGVALIYDAASSRWRAVAIPGSDGGRQTLTAARTYHVDGATGSDANSGRTAGSPFATIQKAIDTAATLDLSIYDVTIQLAPGTYSTTTGNVLKSAVGAGRIVIVGDETVPANVVVVTSGAMASASHANFFARGVRTTYAIRGVQLKSTASGAPVALGVQGGSHVEFQNVDFSTGFTQQIRTVDPGSVSKATGNYAISAGAGIHVNGSILALADISGVTVTLVGTPAFSTGFAVASNIGVISANGASFAGAATGVRYSCTTNSYINAGGSGANFLPGSSSGSTSAGGQYV